MQHERKHDDLDLDRRAAPPELGAVGRGTASDGLAGGRGALASGLLSRKAEVGPDEPSTAELAPDADAHVERAEAGSGSALPEALRAQFEGSLGHDLGHVRVHTGGASAAAAEAVNARAFALGNNIHFGAGQYDPGSTDGQRLIAHEAVHTVQQAGSAPRAQFKLAVSAPGDAHEVEADTLADQMVAATPVTAGPTPVRAGAGVARKPITSAARGIYRWAAGHEYGFRRYSEAPGVRENPKDPWNGPPQDYNAAVAAVAPATVGPPADVDAAPMRTGAWPEPLNGLDASGKDYGLPPRTTVFKAIDAIHALHAAMDATAVNHNGLGARIRDYTTAADQIVPGGALGPAPAGLNWGKPSSGPKDAGSVAERQVPNGSSTSIGDTFKGTEVTGIGAKTLDAGRQGAVSELLTKARAADTDVGTAVTDHAAYIRYDIGKAARSVQDAATALEITDENQSSAQAGERKAELEADKAEALATFKLVVSAIEKIAKAAGATDVKAAVKDLAKEAMMAVAEQVIGNRFEADIKQQEAIMRNARLKIRSLERAKGASALVGAQEELARVIAGLAAKRTAVTKALKARQDAYDAAALEAKKQAVEHGADPKEAERLQTAIAAIPRIEIVISKLTEITAAAAAGAPVDPRAGVAYAAGRGGNTGIAAFERTLGAMKGYGHHYAAEQKRWEARLASAQAVSDGVNVPSMKGT